MKELVSINPYSLQEISSIPELSDVEIDERIENAAKQFINYRHSSFDFRKQRMLNASALLKQRKSELARTITNEMGKLLRESEAEIEKCAWVCEYYAEHAEGFLQGREIKTDATKSEVIYEPLGPVLAVMPWNFPFWQVFRFAAPALMAGNTALLKHASNVQSCAREIENIFRDAGFEPGTFQNLAISSGKVKHLIASPHVKAITLTGSEAAGKAVASMAGTYLKKCVLELGGNNAFVVLNDANLEKALETALTARLLNAGQSCIAAKRFIIEEGVYHQFIDRLSERLPSYVPGDPMQKETMLAPLFAPAQAMEVDRQVRESMKMGAKRIWGGELDGARYTPALLTEVLPGMPVFEEETFGPVVAVSKAKNSEHALELSNLSRFGLGMQVFTTSKSAAQLFAASAEEGAVFVNGMVKSDPRLPFGGVKASGYGRELSSEGIKEFVNIKTIWKEDA